MCKRRKTFAAVQIGRIESSLNLHSGTPLGAMLSRAPGSSLLLCWQALTQCMTCAATAQMPHELARVMAEIRELDTQQAALQAQADAALVERLQKAGQQARDH